MKRKVAKLTIDEVTPERLIEVFIRTVGFEEKPLNEYTQSELIQLLTCAADICSETILNNLGVIGTNLQEQLDQLMYSAKKESSSSSMRPSSDMPRRRKDSEGESTACVPDHWPSERYDKIRHSTEKQRQGLSFRLP